MEVGTKFAWSVSAWPEAMRERLKSEGLVHSGYLNSSGRTPRLSFSHLTVRYIHSRFYVCNHVFTAVKERKSTSLNKVTSMITS